MRQVKYRILSDRFKHNKSHTETFYYFFPKEMELVKDSKTGDYLDAVGRVEFVVEKRVDQETRERWHQYRLPLFGYGGLTNNRVKMAVPITREEFESKKLDQKETVTA